MQRYLFLDLARGFTVLFIPIIHVTMLYSQPQVHESWLGYVLRFIAEWSGAQLLMFIMGINLSFSKKTTAFHMKRAALLFITGYILNSLKFLILLWLGWLPQNFLNDMQFAHSRSAINFFSPW